MATVLLFLVMVLIIFVFIAVVVIAQATSGPSYPTAHPEPPQRTPPPSRAIQAINRTVDEYADLRRNLRNLEQKYEDLKDDREFAEIIVNIHAHYKGRKLDLLLRELGFNNRLLPPGEDDEDE